MIKRLARWILRNETNSEIQRLKNELKMYTDAADDIQKEIRKQQNQITQKTNELSRLHTDYDALKTKCEELKEQNAILRQYYHLDEEPSQETIDKMYLDEKYREQEKELVQLRAYKEMRSSIEMAAWLTPLRCFPDGHYYLPAYQYRLY